MKDVIGLLNCHNSPELGELTANRPLASTSFLGRYSFMDIIMSNFSNSGIDTVGILVKNHQRSLLKHMGNMSSWVNNTKNDKVTLFTNEAGIFYPAYNSDVNNIKENDYFLYRTNASTIVIAAPHVVAPIDLRPIVDMHRKRNEDITVVYKKITDADKEFGGHSVFKIGEDGYVQDVRPNDFSAKEASISLEIWIINRITLARMIAESKKYDASWGIKDFINYFIKTKSLKIHSHEYKGYARCFNSLEAYVRNSFELLNPKVASTLFKEEWPIFTLSHDSTPALYGVDSSVRNSFISNGCLIDGEVSDSIICRRVKIGKNSKIERCIILSGVTIRNDVHLRNDVIDKYSVITARHTIVSDGEKPIYIRQGAII